MGRITNEAYEKAKSIIEEFENIDNIYSISKHNF